MDDYHSAPVSRRTRSGFDEYVLSKREKEKNDNVGSSKRRKGFERVDDDFEGREKEEEDKLTRESGLKRRRFDGPSPPPSSSSSFTAKGDADVALGSRANPYSIDDDDEESSSKSGDGISGDTFNVDDDDGDDDDDERVEMSKDKKEKKELSFSASDSDSSSSSSYEFRVIESPSKRSIEPRSSSKKKKMKKKNKKSLDCDRDAERLDEDKNNFDASETSDDDDDDYDHEHDHDHDHDDDDDDETEEDEAKPKRNLAAGSKRTTRSTRLRPRPKRVVSSETIESSDSEEKSKSKRKSRTKKKKKNGGRDKGGGLDIFKVLVNSMSDSAEKDCVIESLAAAAAHPKRRPEDEPVLPLKFSFPAKPTNRAEKSEDEKEIDALWNNLRVALASGEIGSAATLRVGDEEEGVYVSEDDLDELCERGEHQEYLDDEIGLYCTNCLKTITEIQEIFPPFGKNSSGRSGFRDPGNVKRSALFEEFGLEDPNEVPLTNAELRAKATTVWDMIPGVKRTMYPHQREGFEFIWRHIAGGIDRDHFEAIERSDRGGKGCVISHAPGTGKTRLTIVFLQSLMRLHPKCLPVVVAPSSMLLTWGEEFRKWGFDAPFHNLNSPAISGDEHPAAAALLGGSGRHARAVRMVKLYSWTRGGSVLGVSYTTFEKMAGPKSDPLDQKVRSVLLNSPGVLVLDEGHIPRNKNSLIWRVLDRVRTRRRVVLSGTPFQNNFDELFNTMEMANPSGPRGAQKRDARKDWKALTRSIGDDDDDDVACLGKIKAMIDPFVHVHRGEVLEKSLPGLSETIVVLNPTDLQRTMLDEARAVVREQLQLERAVSLISVHPSLAAELKSQRFSVAEPELASKRSNPDHGAKTKFLMGLIRLCEAAGERVLVFSQYLDPLSLVMEHLGSEFGWRENSEVLYIDGKREMRERQKAINKFNDPRSGAKVLLVSTKAGGEGINLVGASRVVMLDVVWNPSVERQATRRAYRLGQKRFVYVYHLVAVGTMEERKCSRQATKDRWSKMVFSSPESGGGGTTAATTPARVREDAVLDEMVRHPSLRDIFRLVENKNRSSFVDLRAPSSSSNSDS